MKNKSFIILLVGIFLAVPMLTYAETQMSSAKSTAKVTDLTVLGWQSNMDWTTIMETNIKTASQKELIVDASLETGLYTKTTVRSKDMTTDTSTANANVKVRVLVDGQEAFPGEIVFAKRSQELSATLQGQLNLVDVNGDGIVGFDELLSVQPEEISLLLDTMNANSFNFVLPNISSGVHKIEVQAKIDGMSSVKAGTAEAKALIGKGSVTVEEVRFVQGEDIIME